jgi:tRNA (cmo5U34)-methyltransferase
MNDRDDLFTQPLEKQFEFDQTVASVFDDMLERSIPFYETVERLIVDLILARERDGMRVVDLGSSTATFLLNLHSRMQTKLELVGIDNSEAMIERARQKADAFGAQIQLVLDDIVTWDYTGTDVAVATYTLQFVRPMQRLELLQRIARGLNPEGRFIFAEKVVFDDKRLDKEMIDIYYDFKRARGYSEFEIARKREALENVLIPFTISENVKMCKDAGFTEVSTVFQWANFVTFVAQK